MDNDLSVMEAQQIIADEERKLEQEFLVAYNALCQELGFEIVPSAFIMPDGRISARGVITRRATA